jgi:glycogen debranching enzyme
MSEKRSGSACGERHEANWSLRISFPITRFLLFVSLLLPWAFAQRSSPDQQSFLDHLTLSTDSVAPRRFVAVHGRRSLIMGYPEGGLEVWTYPLQILSGYQIGFRPVGATTESDGRSILRRITYTPDYVIRTYIGPNYIVREKLFVPLDRPGAILSYEVEAQMSVDIVIHFTPVLNLMWPGAAGGQSAEWNPDVPGYVLSEPLHKFSAVVGANEIFTHDGTVNSTLRTDAKLSFSVRPRVTTGGPAVATVYVALQADRSKDPAATIRELSDHRADMEVQAAAHHAEMEHSALQIRTPDEDVNRALAWAEVALDQAWVCNPQLGCGMVAGYGPSRDARRPQYAWFFAGDGLVATDALVAAGEYSRARDQLEFIAKYQDPKTGMIWHELSQSAGYLDWSKYPYMFVHVDISFDYLNTVARYVSASGDTAFAVDHWSSIEAAYRYCKSLIRASDNLPHIPADKEAGDEQDRPDDDLGLSSSWVTATNSFAQLARFAGHLQFADEALKANQLAREAIATHYWDSAHHFWIDGHMESGTPIFSRRRGPTQVIAQNVFSAEQNDELLNQLASSDFQSDWGMRGVAASSEIFDPNSYAKGSIFALGTTQASNTFWLEHRPTTAFALWSAILPWNTLDSLGHIHEVLAGNYYREQAESVPEQTWSSAGLLDAAIRGLLGLDIQGAQNRIVFTPHLPAEWGRTSVENIRLPHSTLALEISQSMDGVDLEIRNEGTSARILFEPQLPLGAHLLSAEFEGRPVTADPELFPEDEHAKVEIEAPSGTSHCRLRFAEGVSLILTRPAPHLGDSSTDMKLTSLHLQNQILSIDADVNLAGNATFRMRTCWKIVTLKGATIRPLSDVSYEVTMQGPYAPTNSLGYAHTHVEITLADK